MKISTASKKVLASALSAAMVVAFAPTVALAQVVPGDTVTVKFDTTGLTVKSMNAEFEADGYTAGVNDENILTLPAAALSGHAYQFDATTDVAGWYFDADNDGKYDAKKDITLDKGVLSFVNNANLVNAGNTITLKPFKEVKAGVSIADVTTVKQAYAAGTDVFTLNLSNSKTADADNLRVSIAKDGSEVAYALTSLKAATETSGAVTAATGDVKFSVIGKDATRTAGQIKASDLGKGKYTITVSDAASLKAVATSEFEVVSVHADGLFDSEKSKTNDKVGQDILMVAGQSVESQLNEAAKEIDVRAAKAKADNKSYDEAVAYKVGDKKAVSYDKSSGWVKADGLANSVKVAADTALTPLYGDAAVMGELSIDNSFKKLTATVDYPKAGAEYDFELTGPATATKTVKPTSTDAAANTKDVELFAFDSNGAKAGKYTVTATQVENRGTNAEKKTVVGTSTLILTQLTYDAGEGKLKSGVESSKIVKAGTKWSEAGLLANSTSNTSVEAPEGKRFVGWSTDGATVVAANGTVGEEATTLKAVYAADAAAAPTFTYADGKLTLTNEAGSGYDVQYGTTLDSSAKAIKDPVTYSAPITVNVDKVDTIYVQTVKKAGTTGLGNSAVVTITNYKASAKAVKDWAKLALAGTTGASTTAAPQYYSEVLKTLADDAEAAVKALNYATAKDWAKAELAQKTAVLQAIADYENGQIDALVAGVTAADGSVKKLAASTAAEKKADIAKVIEDFGYNNDNDNKTIASKTYDNPADAGSYVTAIAGASKAAASAATKIAKADVDAAKAVSDKAAKLAADYAEVTKDNYQAAIDAAIDAQTAYAALTKAQLALVTADTQVIAKVIADAAEIADQVKDEETAKQLADAQDLAAARQLYSKTVTAKAKAGKKAQGKSFTYKLGASESGATATYTKTGSKYIKVSKSGKVTFSKVKVSKKAKTYKAKVTVTYGTQTATKTVTYKVKKK